MPNTEELAGLPDSPGVSAKRIVSLDNAIERWRDILETRMSLNEQEIIARDRVLEICHEKGVFVYRYQQDDQVKILTVVQGKEKVKLRNPETEDDSGKDED